MRARLLIPSLGFILFVLAAGPTSARAGRAPARPDAAPVETPAGGPIRATVSEWGFLVVGTALGALGAVMMSRRVRRGANG